MYEPGHFEMRDLPAIHAAIESCGLAHFITSTGTEIIASPLPLYLVRSEGTLGTLYGHFARANNQWSQPIVNDALAIFTTLDAYVTPLWYATTHETGKAVPTWNYEVIHAYGTPEIIHDESRLLALVTHLTQIHESSREKPWHVADAPTEFIQSQLRGIVGFRMPIRRLQGKQKMSQNRPLADRQGVADGLRAEGNQAAANLIRTDK